jgi:LPPG:FO 2-phospho-L-lactate transferase
VIAALAGGVGAARFLTGLVKLIRPQDLTVVVNTGDDIELFGLHIAPDIDIVTYTLAGIVNEEKGWGIKDDTFQCLKMLKKLGHDTWFSVGDKDFATHIYRTDHLKKGYTLSQITEDVCRVLGLKVRILPMTNNKFETRIKIKDGSVHFEEYLVKRHAKDEVLGVEFIGANGAKPSPTVLESISEAETVVVCPSNPVVSIGTILAIDGIRDALKRTSAQVVAVSPLIAGAPVKGPADKLLRGLGLEVSSYGVAKLYSDFLDTFVIDIRDAEEKNRIEQLGVNVKVTNTLMRSFEDRLALAKTVLERQDVTIE